LVIFITLVAALIASLSQILYKKGLTKKLSSIKDFIFALKERNVLIGMVGYLISLVVYLYALANAPLSVVYPVFASTFIFVAIFSSIFLKEQHSKLRYVGILFVFAGIAIIAVSI
jgi:drug/metabolite transporter (DMT)-like permease